MYEENQKNTYIKYCKSFKLYTLEEEKEAFKKLKTDYEKTREQIILHNLRLVVAVAQKYTKNFSFFDILSYGNEGLIYAVDNFDITKDIAFSTYAYNCIENYIKLGINEECNGPIKLTRYFVHLLKKYKDFINRYYTVHGAYPTDEDIINSLKINKQTLELLNKYSQNTLSLDEIHPQNDNFNLYDVLPNNSKNIEEIVENNIAKEKILKLIDESLLSIKQKRAFLYYYNSELCIDDAKKAIGCSKQNIYVLINRAKQKLKEDKKIKQLLKKQD